MIKVNSKLQSYLKINYLFEKAKTPEIEPAKLWITQEKPKVSIKKLKHASNTKNLNMYN